MTNSDILAPTDAGPHGTQPALGLRGSVDARPGQRLGVGGVVLMVVAAAAPLGFVAASVPVIIAISQSVAVPQYFLFAMVILLLFAVGFTTMSKHVRNAGAFYSYVQAGLGRVTGLGAATLALGSYGLLLLAVTAYFGVAMATLVAQVTGAETPWWVCAIASLLVVAFLAYRDVQLSSRLLGILLAAETLVVVILDVCVIASGGSDGMSLAPFSPTELGAGVPGLGLMFAFFGFFGFEATAVFRSEAKNPDTTIPRATFVAVIGIGVFYAISSWAVIIGAGTGAVVESAGLSPQTLVIDLASSYVSPIFADVLQVLLITSIFACALSFHNVITRYQVTLAQQGVLPRRLGRIDPKHNAPSGASLVLSVITVIATVLLAVSSLDPLDIYIWLSGASTLGIVALMALTCCSVIVYFRRKRSDTRLWNVLVAPIGALVGLGTILAMVVGNFPLLTGSVEAAIVLGVLIAATFCVGVVLALIIKQRLPHTFAALGAESASSGSGD